MKYPHVAEYIAECFWPGVQEADLVALDERVARSAVDLDQDAHTVRYLGSLLLREDEVVLCRFEGSEPEVRRVAEGAGVPFERILEAGHSPWTVDPRR